MNFLNNIPAFLVALGILIVVHEMGHYWVARWCGVKVLRFSVGIGKVICSRRLGPDQTEWVISALPLGGYVKMLDARDQDLAQVSEQDLKREFTRQTVWRRIAIVAAGPIANFLLAILIYAGLNIVGVLEAVPKVGHVAEKTTAYLAGLRGGEKVTAVDGEAIRTWSELRWKLAQAVVGKTLVKLDVERADPDHAGGKLLDTISLPLNTISADDLEGDFTAKLGISLAQPAILEKLLPDGPAERAGLRKGDQITEIDGKQIPDWYALVAVVRASPNKLLVVRGLREGHDFTVNLTTDSVSQNGKQQGMIKAHFVPPETIVVNYPPLHAVGEAIHKTWDTSILSVKMIGKMLTGEVSWKNITGPLTIADYAGQAARSGMITFLGLVAFVSISLGVMNLLPVPVLDGGLLLYYSLEVLTGRPVSERFGEIAQRAGFAMLMMLMVVAFYNDILRLMP